MTETTANVSTLKMPGGLALAKEMINIKFKLHVAGIFKGIEQPEIIGEESSSLFIHS